MEVISNGSGDGYGSGYSSGYGNGSGYGSGNGSGDGSGDGYGDGDGNGNGNGYGIKSISGHIIYKIDRIPTVLISIKGNIAIGCILKDNLALEKCFIAKVDNSFAHGKTVKQAMRDAYSKAFQEKSEEERIEEFNNHFNKIDKYEVDEFYDWHNKLTGSCKMGRDNLLKEKGLEMTDLFTVFEFIDIVKDEFGGEIIKKIHKSEEK